MIALSVTQHTACPIAATGTIFTPHAVELEVRRLRISTKRKRMAYEVIPDRGEEVQARIEVNLSKRAQPFFFAVSNQALYIPRIKLIAKTDPYYFQRVLLSEVRYVAVK